MDRNNLYEQLQIDEGVKYEVYNDHLGLPTCGIGHLILENDQEYGQPVGTEVSEERVKELFDNDTEVCINECYELYGENTFDDWPDDVQEILANMMFNMGRTRLSKFKKMNEALEKNDWSTAATEGRDSVWHRQVTNRAERLMSRLENI